MRVSDYCEVCFVCFVLLLMAIEEDVESCGSRVAVSQSLPNPRHHRYKFEVYSEVLRRLQDLNFEEANRTDFDNELWVHFNRLPARYVLA